jgi:hypothetical protein
MDPRDQALLDKQLRRLNPAPRNDGVLMLAIVAVFFVGIMVGGFLFAHGGDPLQIASNPATISNAFSN